MSGRALQVGATIYTATPVPAAYSRTRGKNQFREGEAVLRTLSELTGGELFRTVEEEESEKAFLRIQKELRMQYAVGYEPPGPGDDGRFHRITVQAPKGIRIRCRLGYYATPARLSFAARESVD